MNILRPFFSYYGSKWRAAKLYPAPEHKQIIEPFAGSAAYSLHYPDRLVHLVDVDPIIVGVWEYLIAATEGEILRLPTGFSHINELTTTCQEAKWLIGFWLNSGMTAPCNVPSKWMREDPRPIGCRYWGEGIKKRIASQLQYIRHWRVEHCSYKLVPNAEATWFIDPPYNSKAGQRYRYNGVDYEYLAQWCKKRSGQVIVCEQEGADWLPFIDLGTVKAAKKRYSKEIVWLNEKTG